MSRTVIRLATLLSPALYQTYEYIAGYLGERLGFPTSLHTGHSLAEFARGEAEIGFLCGLVYVRLKQDSSCPVELLAAPVLQGKRYRDAPLYFSDVIVRRDSSHTSFTDLRGCTWAYNERVSHSGYNLVYYSLLQRDLPLDYFHRTIETGSHLQSLRMVLDGDADAAVLDSHMLDVLFQQQTDLGDQLRVVEMLGPSPIPPLVIVKDLDPALKLRIQETLLTMHHDPYVARELSKGRIGRFAFVSDKYYDTIRAMFAQVTGLTKNIPQFLIP
jgi:phosphonate transport system substrate-binding protein